ncbi:OLC1v1001155C1 [Oldenlandia corymbosa var. corymbosa]|uniref:OLC1v1001155C1 n=1 Tax=Oldenlandia corymbosa var. corymbosa TaxID=529605 RepID=A0AAV1D6Y5_OLDCO|nr:OLC1v1001155C1 [Oldenlandia corymbosa var. corymbosa]
MVGDDRGVEAAMGVGDRGVEVDTAGGDRVVETATVFNDRGKAPIPPEWRNEHINELGDDVMLDDALCMKVTSALKECGEDNSGNELGVNNVMLKEDALHKEISSVTKNNDLVVFTLVAYIHFTVDKDGLWTCTKHLVDHNHDLVPNEMIGLLRSQREVDENDMKIIRDMTRSGIPLVDAFKQEQLEVSNDGNTVTYHVWRFGIEHFKHVVVHDTRLQRFSCTCRSSIANEGDGKAAGPLLWKALIMRRFSDLVYASEYNKDAKEFCDEAVDRLKEELDSFIGSNNNDESVDNDGFYKESDYRTRASVASDLHYQSMPFPYPKGAAQHFTGSGSFAAVNASRQSVPSLNVNSGGFSFANPSVAAQHFSWAGASTSVNASDQKHAYFNLIDGDHLANTNGEGHVAANTGEDEQVEVVNANEGSKDAALKNNPYIRDPLSKIVGPMTRARRKRMNESLNSVIVTTWAKEEIKLEDYKSKTINLLQVTPNGFGPFGEKNFGPQSSKGPPATSPHVGRIAP